MIETQLNKLVKENQDIIEYLIYAQNTADSKYIGSLDHGLARINTIILKLGQYPLLADRYMSDLLYCHGAVRIFYYNMRRMETWPKFLKFFIRMRLHFIGTVKFPRIARLLARVENSVRDH